MIEKCWAIFLSNFINVLCRNKKKHVYINLLFNIVILCNNNIIKILETMYNIDRI